MMNDTDVVLFEVLTTGRLQVGVATLNRPRTLNGLTLPMCELLYDKLLAWANDPSIAVVILTGAGKRPSVPAATCTASMNPFCRTKPAMPGTIPTRAASSMWSIGSIT